jgi:thioredoxin-related protein
MKLVKFENTGCPSCDRAKLFLNAVGATDEIEIQSAMPYIEADDAILAGKLVEPIMSFPTFVVFDKDGNEVVGKRMNGFDANRTGELLALVEFVKENN